MARFFGWVRRIARSLVGAPSREESLRLALEASQREVRDLRLAALQSSRGSLVRMAHSILREGHLDLLRSFILAKLDGASSVVRAYAWVASRSDLEAVLSRVLARSSLDDDSFLVALSEELLVQRGSR